MNQNAALSCNRVAIYDLDRTVLRTPTFTLFLLWATWRAAPWRLLLLPLLAGLAIGHGLNFYGRDRFKPFAIRLMLGATIPRNLMNDLAKRFAFWRVSGDVPQGARASIARDRAQGYRLVMATAAPEFYAGAIADALDFHDLVATRHHRDADANWLPAIDGVNCYGVEKARRVSAWLDTHMPGTTRHVRAYSDHASDAPLFAIADEAWLVGRSRKLADLAARSGWRMIDFEVEDPPVD
ncbi:HAD-IB family phosphatase [Sphingopyxis sp.]|uniref:HAD-IB family phosphatase n=1 Tax=Sphingopyxis sp. TaxID=1908224 RepID=UPI001DA3046B|nr:HAD-IB family phosphatase [Sphingopyxis sp.]MBW8294811.1 HAD-IB family phosphatase [Sphingopyxis sp.]